MHPDIRKQISALLSELKGFDFDQLERNASKFGDEILPTGRSGSATVRILRDLVDELHLWMSDGRLEALPAAAIAQLVGGLVPARDLAKQITANIDSLKPTSAILSNFQMLCWNIGLRGFERGEEEIGKAQARIERAFSALDAQALNLKKAEDLVPALEAAHAKLVALRSDAKEVMQQVASVHADVKGTANEVANAKARVDGLFQESERLAAKAKANADRAESASQRFHEFLASIDTYLGKMADQEKRLLALLEDVSKRSEKVVQDNEATARQVEKILARATGASLFKAFEVRQGKLVLGRRFWATATAAFTFLTAALIYYLAAEVSTINASLVVRSLLSLLGLASIGFCAKQYGKERALEEEYAFKSTISLSLPAYEKLIAELAADPEKAQHRDFVIRSVQQIWAPPASLDNSAAPATPIDLQKATKVLREVSKVVAPFVRK